MQQCHLCLGIRSCWCTACWLRRSLWGRYLSKPALQEKGHDSSLVEDPTSAPGNEHSNLMPPSLASTGGCALRVCLDLCCQIQSTCGSPKKWRALITWVGSQEAYLHPCHSHRCSSQPARQPPLLQPPLHRGIASYRRNEVIGLHASQQPRSQTLAALLMPEIQQQHKGGCSPLSFILFNLPHAHTGLLVTPAKSNKGDISFFIWAQNQRARRAASFRDYLASLVRGQCTDPLAAYADQSSGTGITCDSGEATTHESHFTRSASQGEDLRGSKRSRCTRPSTAPVHHMPTPGVSGASHHILKRLPLRQFSFSESSYLLLQAQDRQGQNSLDHLHVTLLQGPHFLSSLAGSIQQCCNLHCAEFASSQDLTLRETLQDKSHLLKIL